MTNHKDVEDQVWLLQVTTLKTKRSSDLDNFRCLQHLAGELGVPQEFQDEFAAAHPWIIPAAIQGAGQWFNHGYQQAEDGESIGWEVNPQDIIQGDGQVFIETYNV